MLHRVRFLTLCGFAISSIVQAGEGPALEILSAVYGVLPDGEKFDVTEKVSKRLKDGPLRLEIANTLFSDPAPQKPKTLFVKHKPRRESLEESVWNSR